MEEESKSRSLNIWKWLFILLLIVNLFIIFRIRQLATPEEFTPQNITETVSDQPYRLQLNVESEEAERIVNDYLSTIAMEGADLEVLIRDQIEIRGSYDWLNVSWPFTLYMQPQVTDQGNAIFTVDDFEIGNLSIPVSLVMNLLASQVDLPDWIGLDSSDQTLTLLFDQVVFEDNFQVHLNAFDLDQGYIDCYLLINDQVLTAQN